MKTQNNKGLLIVITLVIVAIGGYLYTESSQSASDRTKDSAAQATPSIDTSDMLLYTDSGGTFALKYPSSWAYMVYDCTTKGVAFYPADYQPFFKGLTCDLVKDIPVYLNYPDSQSKTKLSAAALKLNPKFKGEKDYDEAYRKMSLTFQAF